MLFSESTRAMTLIVWARPVAVSSAPRRAACFSSLNIVLQRDGKGNIKRVGGKRPGARRPATGANPVTAIRLPPRHFVRTSTPGPLANPTRWPLEAIRRLVEIGLKAKK